MAKSPIDIPSLDAYLAAGYTLMPLHKWNATSTFKGKEREDGKRPVHKDWTKRLFKSAETIARAEEKGNNVGVRLTAEQLVIDVDPRNMPEGRDTFQELCDAIGLDRDDYAVVETGSGGIHCYMSKDANVPVVDSLDGYEGVEFKTKGRQVVAAGSKHPNGNMYAWDFMNEVALKDTPEAPERLMTLIRRPDRSQVSGGEGGEYDQEQIATMLDELDPTDYTDHSEWLTLMMAVHHASGGEARAEFLEWCSRDPKYANDAWMNGRRWDSLSREAPDANTAPVTYKTLVKALTDRGRQSVIPPLKVAEDEFDELPEEVKEKHKNQELEPGDQDDVPEHEKASLLDRMNRKYWAVNNGGKFRIMFLDHDPVLERGMWTVMAERDFKSYHSNKKMEKIADDGETSKKVPVADTWLEWGKRRTAKGVLFDPTPGVTHKGWLNLWTGWGLDGRPGDWPYLRELIYEVLCDGNAEQADFVIKWLAYMVQFPQHPPEVAICFRGDKGTGKSTLGEALLRISGRHGLHVTSPKHVTGDFNSHLMECIFLFADEAVGPRDQKAQAVLKSLITDKHKVYEPKGLDLRAGINRVHVMMASNDDWFVDAGATDGERRYFVSEVSNKRRGDFEFFNKVYEEINGLGAQAMLHDLLTMDLDGWAPRSKIPVSSALTEQKLRNLDPVGQWWFNILDSGDLGLDLPEEGADWHDEFPVKAFKYDVRESFDQFCRNNSIRSGSMNKAMSRFFWKEVKAICPLLDVETQMKIKVPEERFDIEGVTSDGRAAGVLIPCIDKCRKSFEVLVGPVWN